MSAVYFLPEETLVVGQMVKCPGNLNPHGWWHHLMCHSQNTWVRWRMMRPQFGSSLICFTIGTLLESHFENLAFYCFMSWCSFKFSYAVGGGQISEKSSSIIIPQTNEKETNGVREKHGDTFSRSLALWFALNTPSAETWEREVPEGTLCRFTEGFENTGGLNLVGWKAVWGGNNVPQTCGALPCSTLQHCWAL